MTTRAWMRGWVRAGDTGTGPVLWRHSDGRLGWQPRRKGRALWKRYPDCVDGGYVWRRRGVAPLLCTSYASAWNYHVD